MNANNFSVYARPSPCDVRHPVHPGGMVDNSPTFKRWVTAQRGPQVPKGRLTQDNPNAIRSGTGLNRIVVPNVEKLANSHKTFLVAVLFCFAITFSLRAATVTWNGGGTNDNWTTAANWGGVAPVPNDSLFFGGTIRLTPSNNFTGSTPFGGITFNPSSGSFNLVGNSVTLVSNITDNATLSQTISLPLVINAARAVNVAAGSLLISGVISGSGNLTKIGPGVLTLSGPNTYAGSTTVSAGTLFVTGSLASGPVIVANGATLGGTGVIGGPVTVQTGGILQPGVNSIGVLTVNNTLTISGFAVMELNRTNTPLNDRVTGISTVSYGGTLAVTNRGPALQAGDCFTLFSASGYSGAFTSSNLPPLSAGLVWQTSRLNVDGTICVAQNPCPTNKTVECGSSWTFNPPTSAGPCSSTNVNVTVLNTTTNVQGCTVTITRTWQVSDPCTNTAICSQTVTISDQTPPVVNCASNKTVECSSNWRFDPPTATDACCGTNVSITVLSTVTNGTCPPMITRTWQVTDCCGHHDTCAQTITALDTTPPIITCSSNKTVQLGTPWNFDFPTAQDTCCGTNVTIIVLNTVTNNGPCGQEITRTWRATDCCENASTCSQTVTVVSQSTPPQITSVYYPCGGQKITIGFNRPLSPQSAQDLGNYALNCGGMTVPILQAVLAAPQIVCLYLSQPVSSGCFLIVSGVQDVCGNTMPTFDQQLQCTQEPCARGSAGIEYWLTFPGNYAPDPTNPPQPQLFITGPVGTVGNVSIPGLSSPFSVNFNIPAGGEVTVPLVKEADLGDANDVIRSNGVHVIASRPVSVYALNHVQFTSDAYLGLSTDALGKAYFVLAYKNMYADVPELNGSQLSVVAWQDNTTVTIVPPALVSGHAAGVPFSVTLMRGQTYQLRHTNAAPADVTGTLVTSDQPIGVFGSHLCASIPNPDVFFCDHLVEQLFPTDMWGTNFVTVRLATRLQSDGLRFLALATNTTVRTNGVALPSPLNQGGFAEVQLAANSHVTADKPILVAQYANSSDFDLRTNADPFMVLIPPTSLFASSYLVYSPSNFSGNWLNIMAPNSATSQIRLDGNLIPSSAFSAIGTSGYSGARTNVAPGPHTLTSSNAAFGVIVYGWDLRNAYGYPAGLCSPSKGTQTVDFTCPPTNIVLQAGSNCTAVVPDLKSQVGNAGAALLITQNPSAGTVVGTGIYTITVTIVDQYGERHYCYTTLTVAGAIRCPPNIVTNCVGTNGPVVNYQVTLCNTNLQLNCSPASGSVFPPGTNTVVCQAFDAAHPPEQCSFTVTVICTNRPTLEICPNGQNGAVILWNGGATLQRSPTLFGPWTSLPGATSPYFFTPTGPQAFFRLVQ